MHSEPFRGFGIPWPEHNDRYRSGNVQERFEPVIGTFLQAADVKDNWTGMTQFGNWSLPNGTLRQGPSITSISSSSSAGSTVVYAIGAGHTGGVAAVKYDSPAGKRSYSRRCSVPSDLFPGKQHSESDQ